MLGLIVLCEKYGEFKLFKGVCIVGCFYMMIQMAVLIEILVELGVDVIWFFCNIFFI